MPGLRFHSDLADRMVPAATLNPHPENPNNGDVDGLVESLLQNGCYRTVIASRKTGNILAGHTLYAALLECGAEMIPVTWADTDTDNSERRIVIVDNAAARNAKMDQPAELEMIERIIDEEKDLLAAFPDVAPLGIGISDRELANLRALVERDLNTPLDLGHQRGSGESLIHEITCPECGHRWRRGKGDED